jgi:type I restriction enzyme, S subunit
MERTTSDRQAALLAEGDLVVTKSSGSSLHIGKTTLVTPEIAAIGCCYSNFMQRIRLKSSFVPRLAWYVMNNDVARLQFDLLSNSTTGLANLNGTMIGAMVLPVPPAGEQAAIATFLDHETAKIDALIEEQKRLIELLKEKRQAVISHAVTKGLNPNAPMKDSGNQWIGKVPEHWTLMRLKHATSRVKNAFVDGPFGSNLKSEHFIDDGDVYVIESGFATQGRLNLSDLKTISAEHFATIDRSETRGGDIVIAKIGAQFGKSSILPALDKPAVVSGNSLKLTVDAEAFDVNFVNWQLVNLKALGAIEDIVNATAQPALSLGEMSNLPFVAPPKMEQQAIVSCLLASLGELDGLMTEAQRGIDLLQERRTALISAAVTGKIDVQCPTRL